MPRRPATSPGVDRLPANPAPGITAAARPWPASERNSVSALGSATRGATRTRPGRTVLAVLFALLVMDHGRTSLCGSSPLLFSWAHWSRASSLAAGSFAACVTVVITTTAEQEKRLGGLRPWPRYRVGVRPARPPHPRVEDPGPPAPAGRSSPRADQGRVLARIDSPDEAVEEKLGSVQSRFGVACEGSVAGLLFARVTSQARGAAPARTPISSAIARRDRAADQRGQLRRRSSRETRARHDRYALEVDRDLSRRL